MKPREMWGRQLKNYTELGQKPLYSTVTDFARFLG